MTSNGLETKSLAPRASARRQVVAEQRVRESAEAWNALEREERGRGYTLWILGELCSLLGDAPASKRYLTEFVERVGAAPPEKSVALAGELRLAEEILARRSA